MSLTRALPLSWIFTWYGAGLLAISTSGMHRLERTLHVPEWLHPFGFDAFGRDLLQTVLHASLSSTGFALAAVVATSVLGIFIGGTLAMASPGVQAVGSRILEFFLSFPTLLLALAWAAVRGPGLDTLLFSLMIGAVPSFTRLVLVRTRELLSSEFIRAAESIGASRLRILVRHVFPHLTSICSVKLPGLFTHMLLAEATLSFLGIGAPIGRDTWGSLLAQGKDYLLEAPHLALAVGLPLVLTVLSLQVISETLAEKTFRPAKFAG